MKGWITILALLLFTSKPYAFAWQDLWLTPDQQGQALMNKGKADLAKERFKNKDWAATANYRAKDYNKAAALFKARGTEEGFYNLGNSLAQLGQYEQAIKAYNQALSLNPKHADALFNRKLVLSLLKDQQKNKNQQSDNKKNNQEQKDKQEKTEQNQDQQGTDQQKKSEEEMKQQEKEQQAKTSQEKEQEEKAKQDKKENTSKDQEKKANEQQKNEDKQNKAEEKPNPNKAESEAEREKKQAKDQWLRVIPDDPGGLMREKFLRDHLKRMRGWYQ